MTPPMDVLKERVQMQLHSAGGKHRALVAAVDA